VQDYIVIVYCDSNNAVKLSKNQVYHEKTKHIDVKLHFIRKEIARGSMKVMKVSTNHNPSDMIMEVLPYSKFFHCLDLIQLIGD